MGSECRLLVDQYEEAHGIQILTIPTNLRQNVMNVVLDSVSSLPERLGYRVEMPLQ